MAEIKCALIIPEAPGLTSQQLTVGRHFVFQCEGEVPADFNLSQAQLVTAEANKYEFKLMRTTGAKNGFSLDCVSYMAGDIKTNQLQLTDGQSQIAVTIQPIKVDSVLETNTTAEKPQEPFGFTMSRMDWPLGYTVFFILVFCAIMALIILRIKSRHRIRRLMKEMKDYNSAMAADSQFYKNIRVFEKQNYPIDQVEKQFRIYVIRKYQVPLFGLGLNEGMRFIKKRWPTLVNERRELKNILMDLKKMSQKPNPEETKKYLKKLYKFVDDSEDKFSNDPSLRGMS